MTRKDLIKLFEESQSTYSSSKKRDYLKSNSQFFTPLNIANKMIETIDLEELRNLRTITILEPSAGCGILILQLVLHLIDNTNVRNIVIVAYETETSLFNILYNNLDLLSKYITDSTNVEIEINLKNSNFILDNGNSWTNDQNHGIYNIIISNPPFNKINQTSEEAIAMKNLIYGQPNLYSLFIAMSLKLLAPNGIYTVLSPRNYLTGEYSKKIREYIFTNYSLCHVHTFDNRNIFKFVNQEIIISTYRNNIVQDNIRISHNGNFELTTTFEELIYNAEKYSIIIPTSNDSLLMFNKFKELEYTLENLGLKISVGPVVQFRNEEHLSTSIYSDDFAPLLIGNDIQNNNMINYFSRPDNPRRKTHNKSINITSQNLVKNSNYLLLRKVTAKDDKDIIFTAVLQDDFFQHDYLGLDNNLLYVHKLDKEEKLTLEEIYGLYCYFNSTLFDECYSLINGTHTINISDFSNIRLPSIIDIKKLGKKLIKSKNYSKKNCSSMLLKLFSN